METSSTLLSKITLPIGYSDSTGLNVYESYTSNSGFNYFMGVREAGDLIILEKVAEGIATTYLCGLAIYNKVSNVLLKEISVPRSESYTRDKVVKLVQEELMELLISSSKKEDFELNREKAENYISELLDKCYFEKSRISIIEWAINVGLITL